MNRKQKLMIVSTTLTLLIVTLCVASTNIVKTATDDFDLGSNANCSVVVNYYGWNDGVRVTIPLVNAPWLIHNVVVTDLGVDVSWTCTGQYMDWSTLSILGTVELYSLNYQGLNPVDITSNIGAQTSYSRNGAGALNGTVPFVISLSALLNGVSRSGVTSAGVSYWTIKATTSVGGSATDDYGKTWTDSTGLLTAIFTIYDAAAGFSIDGNIT